MLLLSESEDYKPSFKWVEKYPSKEFDCFQVIFACRESHESLPEPRLQSWAVHVAVCLPLLSERWFGAPSQSHHVYLDSSSSILNITWRVLKIRFSWLIKPKPHTKVGQAKHWLHPANLLGVWAFLSLLKTKWNFWGKPIKQIKLVFLNQWPSGQQRKTWYPPSS